MAIWPCQCSGKGGIVSGPWARAPFLPSPHARYDNSPSTASSCWYASTVSIWIAPVSDPAALRPFVRERFGEVQGTLSPDGRWVAFRHNLPEGGEVLVQAVEMIVNWPALLKPPQ